MTTTARRSANVAVPAQAGAADGARRAWEESVLLAEAEAERLADELHNGVMQSLVVARHAVSRESAGHAALPGADEAVRTCLAEIRRAVWHLRPRVLALGALPAAIDELAARVADDHGLELTHDTVVRGALSPARATVAFRLAQVVVRGAAHVGDERVHLEIGEDPYGAVVVRHDRGPAVHAEVAASVWARRGDALGVRAERRS